MPHLTSPHLTSPHLTSPHLTSPQFSVIIPVYNVQAYLDECISSVLAQNYSNYEIILINDGSTDNSLDICLKYAKQYENVFIISKPNSGPDTRNYGINIAKGQYILFLDSDDAWAHENVLSDLENIIYKNNFPDLVLHTFKFIDEETGNIMLNPFDTSELSGNYYEDFTKLVERFIYRSNCWTKVIKRLLINDNPFPVGFIHEDSDYSFNLASKINSYALYNSDFYNYRKRKTSVSYYTCYRNVRDLLTLLEKNIYKLNEVRRLKYSLFQGLFNYLKIEKDGAKLCYDVLNTEEKEKLSSLLNKCILLLNSYNE